MPITITNNNAVIGGDVEISPMASAANPSGPRPHGMPVFVPASQLYYWSFAWRDSERRAMEDLRAGRSQRFDDPTAAVHYLFRNR